MLTENELIELGFKKFPTFTIMNSYTYDIGRNRHLSIGCVGSANEMLFICATDYDNETHITDLICLHNYDYDGYLSKQKLSDIINVLK